MQPAKWYPRAIAAGLYCGERANERAVRALTMKCRPGLSTRFHLERARDARTARKQHSRRGQRAAGCRNPRLLCPSTGSPLCADMPRVWNAVEGRATGWNKDISLAIASLAGLLYRLTLSTGA
jgi:hypothetical protein